MDHEVWDEMTLKLAAGKPNAAQKEPSDHYRKVLYDGLMDQALDHANEVVAEHPELKPQADKYVYASARVLNVCREGKRPSRDTRAVLRAARRALATGYTPPVGPPV